MRRALAMRRIGNAFSIDIKSQFKQGFYFVYMIITFIYMIVLSRLPETLLDYAIPLVIFSDPAVLGLFFIGGIIMLEKNQGVINYLSITPLKSFEYILAKVASLTVLSILAAIVIVQAIYNKELNWTLLIVSLVLSSSMFTLLGFITSVGCTSVNQFMVRIVGIMFVALLPCFSIIDSTYTNYFMYFPSVSAINLTLASFGVVSSINLAANIVCMIVCNIVLMVMSVRLFDKYKAS